MRVQLYARTFSSTSGPDISSVLSTVVEVEDSGGGGGKGILDNKVEEASGGEEIGIGTGDLGLGN